MMCIFAQTSATLMNLGPDAAKQPAVPRDAATVLLLRDAPGGLFSGVLAQIHERIDLVGTKMHIIRRPACRRAAEPVPESMQLSQCN